MVAVPRVSRDASSAASGSVGRAVPAPKASATNWLLDAMRENQRSAGTSARQLPAKAATKPGDERSLTRASGTDPFERHTPNGSSSDEARNPFSRYIEQWMSPQDYAVLRPALAPLPGASLAPESRPPVAGNAAIAIGAAPSSALVPTTTLDPPPHRDGRRGDSRPNPYLEALAPVRRADPPGFAGTVRTNSPIPVPPVSPGPRTTSAGRPEVANPANPEVRNLSSATGIPEFVRPADDEKYFKPLKRF